jgi:hypothetical protein
MELWSRRDPVTLFGAIGMSESGWDRLSRTFPWVASRFSEVSDYRIDVAVVEVSGDLDGDNPADDPRSKEQSDG